MTELKKKKKQLFFNGNVPMQIKEGRLGGMEWLSRG